MATRREFLLAAQAPVVGAAAGIVMGAGLFEAGKASKAQAAPPAEDPILPVYRRWSEAQTGWQRLLDQDIKNEDTPEVRALMDTEDAAFWAMTEMTPTSMAGVAALAHVMWNLDGPQMREGTAPYLEEVNEPKNRFMAAIWRAASGRAGLPGEAA